MRLIDADALIEFCEERWIPLNIDAVNMQPTIQSVATDTNVGGLISRQAAIDAVEKSRRFNPHKDSKVARNHEYEHKHFLNILLALPSVQTEIVRCKDCKYGKQDEEGRWFCTSLGCQVGNEDGSGFCSDAERGTDG